MSYSIPSLEDKRRTNLVDNFHDVICEIDTIKQKLTNHGFDQAAESLRTTIADLHWQVEELVVGNPSTPG